MPGGTSGARGAPQERDQDGPEGLLNCATERHTSRERGQDVGVEARGEVAVVGVGVLCHRTEPGEGEDAAAGVG